jgi:hypothetical protein
MNLNYYSFKVSSLESEFHPIEHSITASVTMPPAESSHRDFFSEELVMIVVRNTFRLKFGKAREALAILKEGMAIQKRAGVDVSQRLLTDMTGTFYTIVLELTLPNLATLEATMPKTMADKEWQANYQKLLPLVRSGEREIFTIVE